MYSPTLRFRPDDTVRHQGGGPVMTVKGYDTRGRLVCSLYEQGHGWLQRAFDPKSVRLVRRARSRPQPKS